MGKFELSCKQWHKHENGKKWMKWALTCLCIALKMWELGGINILYVDKWIIWSFVDFFFYIGFFKIKRYVYETETMNVTHLMKIPTHGLYLFVEEMYLRGIVQQHYFAFL